MGTNGKWTLVNGHWRRAHDDEWLEEVLEALRQAAKQAHLEAYLHGTPVVVCIDGETKLIPPDPDMYEDLIPPPWSGEPLPAAS